MEEETVPIGSVQHSQKLDNLIPPLCREEARMLREAIHLLPAEDLASLADIYKADYPSDTHVDTLPSEDKVSHIAGMVSAIFEDKCNHGLNAEARAEMRTRYVPER